VGDDGQHRRHLQVRAGGEPLAQALQHVEVGLAGRVARV
jgi:hypothetical protein